MIQTKDGSATSVVPDQRGIIIAHITNRRGAWGGGFVKAISDDISRAPELAYLARCRETGMGKTWRGSPADLPLGHVQFVETTTGRFVANMTAQKEVDPGQTDDGVLVDYDAFRKSLRITLIRAIRLQYDVHLPEGIGSGLAGGDKAKIHQIIREVAEEVEKSDFAQKNGLKLNITLWKFTDKSSPHYIPDSDARASDVTQTAAPDADDATALTAADDDLSQLG